MKFELGNHRTAVIANGIQLFRHVQNLLPPGRNG